MNKVYKKIKINNPSNLEINLFGDGIKSTSNGLKLVNKFITKNNNLNKTIKNTVEAIDKLNNMAIRYSGEENNLKIVEDFKNNIEKTISNILDYYDESIEELADEYGYIAGWQIDEVMMEIEEMIEDGDIDREIKEIQKFTRRYKNLDYKDILERLGE